MKYTIHVPDNFQHMNMLKEQIDSLELVFDEIVSSKSFHVTGSDISLNKFSSFVKRFENQGVAVLDDVQHKTMCKSYITSIRSINDNVDNVDNKTATPYFTPTQVAKVYNLASNNTSSTSRVGIAIIELGGGYNPTDLTNYWKNLGLTTIPNVTAISVDGGTNTPGSEADFEVVLDIEVIGGICPNSNIYVYFAPNTNSGFYDAINAAITSITNPVSIVSISWGSAENYWSASTLQAFNSLCQKAALAGITICVASGDNSSSDGETSGNHVDFPASSPWVLSCGGTHLVCPDFDYSSKTTSESVWGTGSPTSQGGGGGFSTVFARPSYQSVATSNYTTQGRAVPDVCGVADPATGWLIYLNSSFYVIGGTSAVAPMWAALLALVNFKSFANNVLYSNWSANKNIFHDILVGSDGYSAGPGWDPASGLGSPNGSLLLPSLSTNIANVPVKHTVKINNPGNQINYSNNTLSLQIKANNVSLGQTLTYSAKNLPNGLSINPSTGLISGIPSSTSKIVTVTTTDITTGISESVSFDWAIIP